MAKNYVGKTFKIKAGTKVRKLGRTTVRKNDSVITVRRQEQARNGKTRIIWKSNGNKASALI